MIVVQEIAHGSLRDKLYRVMHVVTTGGGMGGGGGEWVGMAPQILKFLPEPL